MSKIKFRQTVLRSTSFLILQGCQVQEPDPSAFIVRFRKIPMPGILCRIDFQLMQHFIPPIRAFNVPLTRLKLPDFVADETSYSPLTMDLPSLMRLVYKRNVAPPGKYWEFTDERSLEEQLAKVGFEPTLASRCRPQLVECSRSIRWTGRCSLTLTVAPQPTHTRAPACCGLSLAAAQAPWRQLDL